MSAVTTVMAVQSGRSGGSGVEGRLAWSSSCSGSCFTTMAEPQTGQTVWGWCGNTAWQRWHPNDGRRLVWRAAASSALQCQPGEAHNPAVGGLGHRVDALPVLPSHRAEGEAHGDPTTGTS